MVHATELDVTRCFRSPLVQDYLKLADEYSITAPFREMGGDQTCVLCLTRKASDVFFPCEHKCVCGRCSRVEGFGEEESDGEGGQMCPVCR